MKHLLLTLLTTVTFLTYAQTNTVNSDEVIDTLYLSDATVSNVPYGGTTYYFTSASGRVPVVFKPTLEVIGEGPDLGQGLDTEIDTLVMDVSFFWQASNGGRTRKPSANLYIDGERVSQVTEIEPSSDYQKITFTSVKIPETMDSIYIESEYGWGRMYDLIFEKVSPTITALVEDISNKGVNEFSIYPNPAIRGEQMTIQIDNELISTIEVVEILNMSGQVVTSFSSIQDMNTAALPRGVYYVNIKTTEGFMKVNKLVIK